MKKKKKIGLSLNKFKVSSLTNLSKEKILGGDAYSQAGGGCTATGSGNCGTSLC